MMFDPAKLLTVCEAGKLCPYSEGQLRSWIRDGRLPALRLAERIYIDEAAFQEFLKKRAK